MRDAPNTTDFRVAPDALGHVGLCIRYIQTSPFVRVELGLHTLRNGMDGSVGSGEIHENNRGAIRL